MYLHFEQIIRSGLSASEGTSLALNLYVNFLQKLWHVFFIFTFYQIMIVVKQIIIISFFIDW